MQESKPTDKESHLENVTIRVPKAIMLFLRDMEPKSTAYIERTLVEAFRSDMRNDEIRGSSHLVKRYNLENFLRKKTEKAQPCLALSPSLFCTLP